MERREHAEKMSNKRRKENDETETEGETIETIVRILYHKIAEHFSCACGEKINAECLIRHICPINLNGKTNLEIINCDGENKCKICISAMEKQRKEKLFLNQWNESWDEVYTCNECGSPCEYGELPKDCYCDWYTDEGEVDRCNECNIMYDGRECQKCTLAWYKDDNGQLRCSTCDITLSSMHANKPCECDHFYTDEDGTDRCKKCHAENDGDPCIKCK